MEMDFIVATWKLGTARRGNATHGEPSPDAKKAEGSATRTTYKLSIDFGRGTNKTYIQEGFIHLFI